MSEDDLEARMRRALRQARTAAGMSLVQVATAAGMSESTLSRIETGDRRLTLAAVDGICRAVGVQPESVLRSAGRDGLRITTPAVRLAGGQHGVVLGHDRDGSVLMRLVIPAGEQPVLATHPGHDFVHVLRGRVRLHLGADRHDLVPGESVHFDTDRPHGIVGLDGTAEVLVRTSPGAHGHAPARPGDQDPFGS